MDNSEELATLGTQDGETGNIGYTRRRNWQHRVHKTKDKPNIVFMRKSQQTPQRGTPLKNQK